jgi:hypothetical protein
MELPRYQIEYSVDSLYYEFVSKGTQGSIVKAIQYDQILDKPLTFNLSFGDKLSDGGIEDNVVSNNGDTDMVLATVAATIPDFFTEYPTALLYFIGLGSVRTRLYQMTINKFMSLIPSEYLIYGELEGKLERFKPKTNYKSFVIKKQ